MLGRVRRPSSLDSLERPPSKIIKDDSLSVYEATLEKLMNGSRRAFSSSTPAVMKTETNCFSESPSSSTDGKASINEMEQQMGK